MSRSFTITQALAGLAMAAMIGFAPATRAETVTTTTTTTYDDPSAPPYDSTITTTREVNEVDPEVYQKCIDHHGVFGPDGCYISDRNERIRMLEEEGAGFRFRAHEAGVYDRD
jgi:hypothetical protein